MIRFEIKRDPSGSRFFYGTYCRQVFSSIKRTIRKSIDPRKYEVRKPYIMSIVRWNDKAPSDIDLVKYINNCLVLRYVKGNYVIELNDRKLIQGSTTTLKYIVRLLEYGNEKIPPYPLITRVLEFYSLYYKEMFIRIVKEEFK